MEIVLTNRATKELDFWKKSGNTAIQKRITVLTKAILESPYGGIGKPEALRANLTGYWSRRINREHRLVYGVDEAQQIITIISLRFHY